MFWRFSERMPGIARRSPVLIRQTIMLVDANRHNVNAKYVK